MTRFGVNGGKVICSWLNSSICRVDGHTAKGNAANAREAEPLVIEPVANVHDVDLLEAACRSTTPATMRSTQARNAGSSSGPAYVSRAIAPPPTGRPSRTRARIAMMSLARQCQGWPGSRWCTDQHHPGKSGTRSSALNIPAGRRTITESLAIRSARPSKDSHCEKNARLGVRRTTCRIHTR